MKYDDLETLPAAGADNNDDDVDGEANAVLRAIAHSPPRRPASLVVPGMRWGEAERYRIDRRLGRGGMGSVYAATDMVLERIVALKVLDVADAGQDAAYKKQVLREAKLAARVEHERIARVYDVGSSDGLGFVAMEYVHGHTLRHWMAGRKVPVVQVMDIAIQIAEGLAALHKSGIVHRDLKPENVMLTAQGAVKLLDFGLARSAIAPSDAGAPGRSGVLDGASVAAVAGTPGYMAPEQYDGQPLDARVDIFALGVILYELVTGERLFRGNTMGAIMQATLASPPALCDATWRSVPEPLRDHTARMLARDPGERFEDGASVLAALRELSGEGSRRTRQLPEAFAQSIGKAPPHQPLPRRWFDRTRRALARKAIEISCAIVAVIFLAVQPRRQPPPSPPPGMARIDVGTIQVGTDERELERACAQIGPDCDRDQMLQEAPRIEVTVAPFFLDQHEVTNKQFAQMLNEVANTVRLIDDSDDHYPRYVDRSAEPGTAMLLLDLHAEHGGIEHVTPSGYRARPGHEHVPVVQVSWYGAKLYCASVGKRLPTENEWEAAARGRENRRFPWGDAPPSYRDLALPCDGIVLPRSSRCPEEALVRAGGASPQDVTPEGVHDLAGNVSEWTSSVPTERKRVTRTPAEPAADAARVTRGGSWATSWMARPSGRRPLSPSAMAANVGFRCASDADAGQL
jgi:serine/threonine protein kinase